MFDSFTDIMSWIKDIQKDDLSSDVFQDSEEDTLAINYSLLEGLKKFLGEADEKGRTFLHAAVAAKKPNLVKFLALHGADINAVKCVDDEDDCNYDTPICMALELFEHDNEKDKIAIAKDIFGILLAYRKPISKEDFFEYIGFCLKYYKKPSSIEDEIFNIELFDKIASRLIGERIAAVDFFDDDKEDFSKYVGHLNELTGINEETDVDLESFADYPYMVMRIRIFLQIFVEKILIENSSNILSSHQWQESFCREFLVELETCWLSILICNINNKIKKNENNQNLINNLLTIVGCNILKKINLLEDENEILIYSGWYGHAICIAFVRDQDRLRIRIDNLGSNSKKGHYFLKGKNDDFAHIAPRILTEINFPIKNKTFSKRLLKYITLILKDTWQEKNKKNYRITNIYKPPRGFLSIDIHDARQGSLTFRSQPVGNCVVASHIVGQKIRLGDNLFTILCSFEVAILRRFNEISDKLPKPLSFEYKSEKTTEQFNQLLLKYYQAKLPKESLPYIMMPSLCLERINNPAKKLLEIQNISLSNLFSNYFSLDKEGTCKVLIRGGAGMGKTTLCLLLASEWQKYSICDAIFYIPLRNLLSSDRYPTLLNEQYSLIDLIERECFFPVLKRNLYYFERFLLEQFIQSKKIIWIIDGLDELYILPHLEKAIKELSQQPYLILTSRPHIGLNIFSIDIELQFQNYLDLEIKEFITKFFNSANQQIEASKLIDLLGKNSHLKTVGQTPIGLSKLCQLWQEGYGEQIEKAGLMDINEQFSNFLLRKAFISQLKLSQEQSSLIDPINVKYYYRHTTRFSESLAFNSLFKQKRIFLSKELVDENLEQHFYSTDREDEKFKKLNAALKAIGILKLDSDGGEFIHATFQEFYAASYLAKNLARPIKDKRYLQAEKFILLHKKDLRYQLVLIYTACFFEARIKNSENKYKKNTVAQGGENFWKCLLPNEVELSFKNLILIITIAESCYEYMLDYQQERLKKIEDVLKELIKTMVGARSFLYVRHDGGTIATYPHYKQLTDTLAQSPRLLNKIICKEFLLEIIKQKSLIDILNFIQNVSCFNKVLLEYFTSPDFLEDLLKASINDLSLKNEPITLINELVIDYACFELKKNGLEQLVSLEKNLSFVLSYLEKIILKRLMQKTNYSSFMEINVAKVKEKLIDFFNIANSCDLLNDLLREKNKKWLIHYINRFAIYLCEHLSSNELNLYSKLLNVKDISWISELSEATRKKIEKTICYSLNRVRSDDGESRRNHFNIIKNALSSYFSLTSNTFREKAIKELLEIARGKHKRYQRKTQGDYESEALATLYGYKADLTADFLKQSLNFLLEILSFPVASWRFHEIYQNNPELLNQLRRIKITLTEENSKEILDLLGRVEEKYSSLVGQYGQSILKPIKIEIKADSKAQAEKKLVGNQLEKTGLFRQTFEGVGENALGENESAQRAVSLNIPGLVYKKMPERVVNSLFHAIALYLELNVNFLRNIILLRLKMNLEKFSPLINLPEGKAVEDYLAVVRNGTEWAGHVEIEVLMQVLNRSIIVITPDSYVGNRDILQKITEDAIFVYCNNHNHYDVFLRKEGYSVQDILSQWTQFIERPQKKQAENPLPRLGM